MVVGWAGERYIKCFCQQFSSFNRKKDQNERFEGGGRGHGRDSVSACEGGEKVTRLMRRKRVVGVFIFKK